MQCKLGFYLGIRGTFDGVYRCILECIGVHRSLQALGRRVSQNWGTSCGGPRNMDHSTLNPKPKTLKPYIGVHIGVPLF